MTHETQIFSAAEYWREQRGLNSIPAAYSREQDYASVISELGNVVKVDGEYVDLVGALKIGEPARLIKTLEHHGFRGVGKMKKLADGSRINTRWVYRPRFRDAEQFYETCEWESQGVTL